MRAFTNKDFIMRVAQVDDLNMLFNSGVAPIDRDYVESLMASDDVMAAWSGAVGIATTTITHMNGLNSPIMSTTVNSAYVKGPNLYASVLGEDIAFYLPDRVSLDLSPNHTATKYQLDNLKRYILQGLLTPEVSVHINATGYSPDYVELVIEFDTPVYVEALYAHHETYFANTKVTYLEDDEEVLLTGGSLHLMSNDKIHTVANPRHTSGLKISARNTAQAVQPVSVFSSKTLPDAVRVPANCMLSVVTFDGETLSVDSDQNYYYVAYDVGCGINADTDKPFEIQLAHPDGLSRRLSNKSLTQYIPFDKLGVKQV